VHQHRGRNGKVCSCEPRFTLTQHDNSGGRCKEDAIVRRRQDRRNVGVDSDDLDEGQWVRDIGRKSPFARHLCGAAANVDKKVAADNSQTANDLHSHECFNVVTQLTAFFPMCSCLMHGSGDSSSNAPYWNAAVESHFRDTENVNADTTPST